MIHIGGRTLDIFTAAFEASPVGMCLMDVSGRMLRANAALCDLLGKSAEDTRFTAVTDLVHEDDRDTIDALHLLVLKSHEAPEPFERRFRRHDGSSVWVRMSVFPVLADGVERYFAAVVEDLTEIHALRAQFETMVEHSTDTYGVIAPDMTLLYASPASLLYRVPIGTPVPMELVHEDDRERVLDVFARVCAVGDSSERVRFRAPTTVPPMHVEARFTNLIDHASVRGVMVNTRDVTKEVTTTQALNYQAFHDGLTGLANRASLVRQLGERIRQASATGTTVTVEMLDLDRFKLINDAHGYAVGNEVLQLVAKRLTAAVNPGHVVARLGADEFVVMGEGYDTAAATDLARRLAMAVSTPITLSTGDSVVVTASIGIAVAASCDPEALLWEADTALYRAKDRGRDTWEFFDDQLRDRALVRHQTEQRVRRALAENGFGLGYQPMVSLRSGRVVEAEALLRMRLGDPEPSVSDVVIVAEETGLIHDIGSRALRQATRQAAEWKARLGPLAPQSVSVNVSGRQLYGLDFAAQVGAALTDATLSPECLCLELTESTLLEADRRVTQQLFALKDLGVDLAIDDFGTGYSSLTYLKRFPIDVIKIDRSFVAGVGTDASDSEIVRAVIGLGQALGLRTVAEGVEHESQAVALRALGCDRAQGYFYSPALDAEGFVDFLTARNA